MKISGHNTTAMELRYNIVDDDGLQQAKQLMQKRSKSEK